MAFPAFRGWSQQDSQEFLRCFLDQLHQELRQPLLPGDPRLLADDEDEEEAEAGDGGDFMSTAPSSPVEERRPLRLGERDESESSSSSSQNSTPGERYETADSGCSSDLEASGRSRVASECGGGGGGTERGRGGRQRQASLIELSSADSGRSSAAKRPANAAASQSQPSRKRRCNYRSIVTDVFDGRLISRVKCLACKHVSATREAFQDLSLPIPAPGASVDSGRSKSPEASQPDAGGEAGSWGRWLWGWAAWAWSWVAWPEMSLADCLAAFFSPDHLRGDDMYSCDKCNKSLPPPPLPFFT